MEQNELIKITAPDNELIDAAFFKLQKNGVAFDFKNTVYPYSTLETDNPDGVLRAILVKNQREMLLIRNDQAVPTATRELNVVGNWFDIAEIAPDNDAWKITEDNEYNNYLFRYGQTDSIFAIPGSIIGRQTALDIKELLNKHEQNR